MINLDRFRSTDIGENATHLYETTAKYQNSIFIDLGVRSGVSSEIMLTDALKNNNRVFGIDVDWSMLNSSVSSNPNFSRIPGDSSTVGKRWNGRINGLFVDTFHIKEQVLSELYFWYPHLQEGGFIAFHDTNWPEGKHDFYGGVSWDRVEDAIKLFFQINSLSYEDDFIKVVNHPDSWGMTIVEIKKKRDYISEFKDWEHVIDQRNRLINIFWNEENRKDLQLELELKI